MARVSPAEFADKWKRRISAATQDVRTGVERVTVAPTEKAAAKKDKMLSRLTDAMTNGKWEAGLRRVSLQDWKDAMLNKGLGRIAQGAEAATTKVEAFAGELLPHIDAGRRQLEGMPDITIEDSINRVGTFLRHMHTFRRAGAVRR
jgi:hypothetical protein